MNKMLRWDPLKEMGQMKENLDRFMGRVWSAGTGEHTWSPAVDIVEEGDNLIVRADLPGVKKDDISVSVSGDTMTLNAKSIEEKKEKQGNTLYQERFVGTFSRSFTLPMPVDRKKIKASYKDGVLEITMPKAEEAKAKEVKVEVE